jgi:hypothetical protein
MGQAKISVMFKRKVLGGSTNSQVSGFFQPGGSLETCQSGEQILETYVEGPSMNRITTGSSKGRHFLSQRP